ncbi:MAG: hypothetical protein K2O40_09405 [Lachnospiraceae bacterium]|nr:hypothetical protein [Lachnospiraceae bacterium]
MKKCFIVLNILLCCMLYALPVRADIIWEPDDNFYNRHAAECTYVNRMFTANGPDGVVIVYQSPESPQIITQLDNGSQTQISFTYQSPDGILWGIFENADQTGWLPMDYMNVVYDSISFVEDYADEIVAEDGVLDTLYQDKDIYLWKYPGSEASDMIQTNRFLPSYESVYHDEQNRRWGNVGYYLGMRNVWICLDDPTADFDTLYPSGAPVRDTAQINTNEPDAAQSIQAPSKRIVPKQNTAVVMLTVTLVLAVMLATAGLLLILKRKK